MAHFAPSKTYIVEGFVKITQPRHDDTNQGLLSYVSVSVLKDFQLFLKKLDIGISEKSYIWRDMKIGQNQVWTFLPEVRLLCFFSLMYERAL